MNSRALNRIVLLQRRGDGRDEAGQPLPDDWVDVGRVWANILFLNGVESLKADSEISVAKASVRILRRVDLTASMRVVMNDGAVFDIKAVLLDEVSRDHIDLACETGANEG